MYFYSWYNAPERKWSFVQSQLFRFESEVVITHPYSYCKKWLALYQGKYLSLSPYENTPFISINWVENILLRKKKNSF